MANVPLRVAALRISANADGLSRLNLARHVTVTRQSRTGGAAAVRVFTTDIAIDMATTRGLAHLHARGGVGSAQSAAAVVTIAADGTIDSIRAIRRTLRRSRAHTKGAASLLTVSRATRRTICARVTALNAEGSTELTGTVVAETRTALRVIRTGISRRKTREIERLTHTGVAISAATGCRIRARLIVRDARCRAALGIRARHRATLGGRGARTTRSGALVDSRRAGFGGWIANTRATVRARAAELAEL